MAVRNDPGGDYGSGVGGNSGGSFDDWLNSWLSPGDSGDPNYPGNPNYDLYHPSKPGTSSGGSNSGGGGAAVPGAGAGASGLGSLAGIAGLASKIATLLGGTAAGLDQGRIESTLLNQQQARAQADIFNTRMRAALAGPRLSAEDVARGDVMANEQPFQFDGGTRMSGNIPIPTHTGGPGPQNFGPNTRAAGQALSNQGLSRITSPAFDLPTPPVLPPIEQAGLGTNILRGASAGSGLLGFILNYLGQHPSNQTTGGTNLPRYIDPTDTSLDNIG
jgi:hypothetical protein